MTEMIGSTYGQQSHSPIDGKNGGDGIVSKVRETATAQLTNQKNRATDGLGTVAQAVRQSTQQLRDEKHDTLAGYVEQAANQMDRLSQRLRNKDVSELVGDVQRLAKSQPALFIGGAFAVGLIAARFFKSSADASSAYERSQGERYQGYESTNFSRAREIGAGEGGWSGSQPSAMRTPSTEGGMPRTDIGSDSPSQGTGRTTRTRRGAQTEHS